MEGFRKVDAVMADERYRAMIKLFMNRDVTPYVPVPEGVDLEAYKDQLIERFSNKAISDQVSRLCGDGIAKFAVYVVPILKQMLQDGKDISIEAFLIAVYCKYLIGARTESGENIAISEPHITPADRKLISGGSPAEFLKISPFVSLGLDKCLCVCFHIYNISANVSQLGEEAISCIADSMFRPMRAITFFFEQS